MTHSHFPAPHEASQFIVKFMRHNINIDRHHHPIQYQTKYLHKRNAAEQNLIRQDGTTKEQHRQRKYTKL